MIEFYNNWISGLEVHQAFQNAQQSIKKEYPSPYYWAGFVMLD
jgi:CHAT domain-containing protein